MRRRVVFCTRCGAFVEVRYDGGTPRPVVQEAVEVAHRLQAPRCRAPVSLLRLLSDDGAAGDGGARPDGGA